MPTLLIHHNGGGGVEQFLKGKLTNHAYQLYKQGEHFILVGPAARAQAFTSFRSLVTRLYLLGITDVLIHHLWGHKLDDVEALLGTLNCPYSIYLHDHYACCPLLFFVTSENRYCGMELDPDSCDQCVSLATGSHMRRITTKPNQSVREWRSEFLSLYKKAESIIAPSQSTRENYLRYFPELTIKVEPHHVANLFPKAKADYSHTDLHVAIIGNVFAHKGEQPLAELLHLTQNKPVRFFSYGKIAPSLQKYKNIIERGSYSQDVLGAYLQNDEIDLVCIPSFCPETFSFTTHESLQLGYPVLCFRLGAQAEAVMKNNAGWTVRPFTGEALFKKVMSLTTDLNQIKIKKEEMGSHFNK
ncbi:glycosyltransferase [Bacillus sp. JCM 19045]|nr:glycosyltransferase [Bacillus sp. JCM 19045]